MSRHAAPRKEADWLLYVQRPFEDAYWETHGEWSNLEATLRASLHLKPSPVLQ